MHECSFLVSKVIFLKYEVSAHGLRPNDSQVRAILEWPTPTTITQVKSGTSTSYRCFGKDFSRTMLPFTDLLKNGEFSWTKEATQSFEKIKSCLVSAPCLQPPDFNSLFEVECDTSKVGFGAVLCQHQKPIAFFSEKLSVSTVNYSTYNV